jgi:hypothetical protein
MSNPAPFPRPPNGGALRLQQNDAGESLATERWNSAGAPIPDSFIARS